VEEDTCLANDEEGKRKCEAVNAWQADRTKKKGSGGLLPEEEGATAKLDLVEETVSRDVLPVAPGRVRIEVPPELKCVLVEDWDQVVKKRSLVRLPCAPERTVAALVDKYLAFLSGGEAPQPSSSSSSASAAAAGAAAGRPTKAQKKAAGASAAAACAEGGAAAASSSSSSSSSAKAGVKRPRGGASRPPEELQAIRALLEALLAFFEKKLAVGCLYRREVMLFQSWCREPSVSAAVGGGNADDMKVPLHAFARHWPAEMLLRLLVLLPDIFHSERSVTSHDAEFINSTLGDFIKWLAKNYRALFVTPATVQEHYAPSSPAYLEHFEKVLKKKEQNKLPALLLAECYAQI
jgi:hypothetical protein